MSFPSPMLIVDAHEDLAWNMLTFGRDYTSSAYHTREVEDGQIAPEKNGHTLLGYPEYQDGHVAVVFATLFAAPYRAKRGEWDTQCYRTPAEAYELYLAQLDAYHRLVEEQADAFRLIPDRRGLKKHLADWEDPAEEAPVGLVVLMEGAEGVRDPSELAEWYERGVRLVGPAWRGTRFCGGTREPGGLTRDGRSLLEAMADLNLALDVSHMDEQAVLEALDLYPGPIIASHANAKALLKRSESNRHLTDRMIEGLLDRDAVIGIVPYNCFLQAGWRIGDDRSQVTLNHVVAQIDTICQRAGDADHVGIGSDFDGGFGLSGVPAGIDTIADLVKLKDLLGEKGYSEEDIGSILGKNWLNKLDQILP